MRRRFLQPVLAVIACLFVAACGFHLRGAAGSAVLPPALASLRVTISSGADNGPLITAVRQALVQAGAQLVTNPQAPTVVLLGEQHSSDVISVSTATAKASEYRLRYVVTFRVDGAAPVAEQAIRLQREYSLDSTRVLAKEQEEQELLRAMRQDAAQQLVRRLARSGQGSPAKPIQ